jgi:hypothetical protein
MKTFHFICSLLLFFGLIGMPVSAADTSDSVSETGTEQVSTPEEGVAGEDTFVDSWHRALSGTITGPAYWIDSFFYDERIEAEENQSRLLLRLESFTEDGEGTDLKLKANLRVRIPYAEKKLKLIITGEPDDETEADAPGNVTRRSFDRIDQNDVAVALQHSLMEELDRYFSTKLGFVFRNWRPRLFLEGRARIFFNLDQWGARFTERLRWYTDKGWESRTTFDFERPLSERVFFRTTVEGDWLEDQDGFPHSLTFAVAQLISPRRAIEYSWNNSIQTRPNHHLDQITLAARYRQRIWRDWLFYDIEPQLRFPKSDGFRITPGIMLRIEAIVGMYDRL